MKHQVLGLTIVLAVSICAADTENLKGNASFSDPLNIAAEMISGAMSLPKQPMIAATLAGHRVVTVGLRGVIAYSDDQGRNWHQAKTPVQSDLVAVQFLSPQQGWATGHDGVILHTVDAGATWSKQFETQMAKAQMPDFYRKRAEMGEAGLASYLDQVKLNTEGGTSLPYLSVWFESDQVGYAVGAFGMIVHTQDGGKNWIPWLDKIDNPQFLNLNAIREIGGEIYISGEHGGVYRLNRQKQRFVSISTDYKGSFFDIAGTGNDIVVVGLRGTVYRSIDGGANWRKIETGTAATLTGSAVLADGAIVIVSEDGKLLASHDQGATFRQVPVPKSMSFAGVADAGAGHVTLVGYHGVEVQALTQ